MKIAYPTTLLFMQLFMHGCACWTPCGNTACTDMFDYRVDPYEKTNSGVGVDASGHDVDLLVVDGIFDVVEDCLTSLYPNRRLADGSSFMYGCMEEFVSVPINRDEVKIKIPEDYRISKIDGQQLLTDMAPEEGCENKGLDASKGCYWRSGIQDGCVIVTTPSLYMMPDPLVQIVTRCRFVWSSSELSECARPLVDIYGNPSSALMEVIENRKK